MPTETPAAIGHYSAAEVGRLAGVSPQRVGSWARYGIIPSISQKPRVYSYADAGEAVLVRYLLAQSFPTAKVRQIVENLRKDYGQWPLATAPLQHDGRLAVIQEGNDVFIDAADSGDQHVIAKTLIDLKAVREALSHGGWVSYLRPRDHIEVDPERLSGQPVVRDTRVLTATVADLARRPAGMSLLKGDYDLTDAEIEDAVAYEADVAEALAA
jgi:uncharacterized protein (DUF433 family)/DNA-binding transcriptional MerR regulator